MIHWQRSLTTYVDTCCLSLIKTADSLQYELPPLKELPPETNLTTQFPLAPQVSEAIQDSMEIDNESSVTDPDETQDEQSVVPPTPIPSSSLQPQPTRMAALIARQAAPHVSAVLADVSQTTRYSIRHRNTVPSSSQDINSSDSISQFAAPETLGKKRGRHGKDILDLTTSGSKRLRMKSSMTSGLINIGDYLTPSPASKLGRSNLL